MQALIITDREYHTQAFAALADMVETLLARQGAAVERVDIDRGEVASCMGCFGCWVKKPGECVIGDKMAALNRKSMNSDVTVYLCPVVFGQFSATMKDVIDRWLPNVLPFFIIRADGSTMHPMRYDSYPRQIMIGYGDILSDADAALFSDIILKHRRDVDVLVYRGDINGLAQSLAAIPLERTVPLQ